MTKELEEAKKAQWEGQTLTDRAAEDFQGINWEENIMDMIDA